MAMKIGEIREIAKQHRITAGRLKKAELVRAIQQIEKNDPCFETGKSATCGQANCLWREDCH